MSHTARQRPNWQVRRTFETNRLAQAHLQEAYEQIVPIHIRVVSRHQWDRMTHSSGGVESVGREGRAA